jgi:hypothetical protein
MTDPSSSTIVSGYFGSTGKLDCTLALAAAKKHMGGSDGPAVFEGEAELLGSNLGADYSVGTGTAVELRVPHDLPFQRHSGVSSWSKVDTKAMLIPP